MGSITARISRKVDPLAVDGRIPTSKTPVETLLNNLFDSVFIGTVEQPDALEACLRRRPLSLNSVGQFDCV